MTDKTTNDRDHLRALIAAQIEERDHLRAANRHLKQAVKAMHGAKTAKRKQDQIDKGLDRLRVRFGMDDHDLQH